MSFKKCCKCHQEKELSLFGKDLSTKDGLRYNCKECANKCSRERKKKKIKFKCESCKEEKEVDFYSFKRRKTKFCLNCVSKKTQKGIKKDHLSGPKSSRWNGGEYISSDGYLMAKVEGDFFPSGKQKYKRKHILIYENFLGREIDSKRGESGEQIHHIDGNKLNNKLDNLILCNGNIEHRNLHCQLEDIAFKLVRDGLIKFDKKEKKYYLNEE